MRAQDVRLAIAGVAANAEALLYAVDTGIDNDGESMLPGLVTIDAAIHALKQARLTLLRHERVLGTSWNEIEQATGTHASTWRFRHDKGVLGA
jgi:hypothetical protein